MDTWENPIPPPQFQSYSQNNNLNIFYVNYMYHPFNYGYPLPGPGNSHLNNNFRIHGLHDNCGIFNSFGNNNQSRNREHIIVRSNMIPTTICNSHRFEHIFKNSIGNSNYYI